MAKLSLAEFTEGLAKGETFRVDLPSGDHVELVLRSPKRADAERVVARITGGTESDAATGLSDTLSGIHEALLACCPEVSEDNVVPLVAAGGPDLQSRLFALCGLGALGEDGAVDDDPGKNSPTATS